MTPTVLKHGVGYDLVVVQDGKRLVLAIRCHGCTGVSLHPEDVRNRYCDVCKVYHEAHLFDREG